MRALRRAGFFNEGFMEVILGCGPSGGNFENVNDIEFSCSSLYYSFQYCASIYDAIML